MRRINICGGRLCQYDNDNPVLSRAQHVEHLIFDKTDMDENCLSSLVTCKFSKLEVLGLNDCNISGRGDDEEGRQDNRINITVPDTSISTLQISKCDPIRSSLLLISVRSNKQNITEYFIDVAAGDEYTEISQANFDAFRSSLKPEDLGIVSVTAKSVKKVKLFSHGDAYAGIDRNFELDIF